MTNRRAMELLMIERACVRKGSGMDWVYKDCGECYFEGYAKVTDECDRDCAHCELVQKSEELLEMYDFVIRKMIEETEKEESEQKEWKEWQLCAEEEKYGVLTI